VIELQAVLVIWVAVTAEGAEIVARAGADEIVAGIRIQDPGRIRNAGPHGSQLQHFLRHAAEARRGNPVAGEGVAYKATASIRPRGGRIVDRDQGPAGVPPVGARSLWASSAQAQKSRLRYLVAAISTLLSKSQRLEYSLQTERPAVKSDIPVCSNNHAPRPATQPYAVWLRFPPGGEVGRAWAEF